MLGVWPGAVFQVFTPVNITYSDDPGTFFPGGRTGAATVSYCVGSIVTPTGNPGCASAGAGSGPVLGLMIYTATAAQFGGAMTGRFHGISNFALYGGQSTPPCSGSMCPPFTGRSTKAPRFIYQCPDIENDFAWA